MSSPCLCLSLNYDDQTLGKKLISTWWKMGRCCEISFCYLWSDKGFIISSTRNAFIVKGFLSGVVLGSCVSITKNENGYSPDVKCCFQQLCFILIIMEKRKWCIFYQFFWNLKEIGKIKWSIDSCSHIEMQSLYFHIYVKHKNDLIELSLISIYSYQLDSILIFCDIYSFCTRCCSCFNEGIDVYS